MDSNRRTRTYHFPNNPMYGTATFLNELPNEFTRYLKFEEVHRYIRHLLNRQVNVRLSREIIHTLTPCIFFSFFSFRPSFHFWRPVVWTRSIPESFSCVSCGKPVFSNNLPRHRQFSTKTNVATLLLARGVSLLLATNPSICVTYYNPVSSKYGTRPDICSFTVHTCGTRVFIIIFAWTVTPSS